MTSSDCCRRLFKLTFLAAIFIACISGACLAEENNGAASAYLCEYGMKLYKQGNSDDAIDQLKKALIVNPNNSNAQRFLEKIIREGMPPVEEKKTPPEKQRAIRPEKQRAIRPEKPARPPKEHNRSYDQELKRLKEESLSSGDALKKLSRQFDSLREGYEKELSLKEKELAALRLQHEEELSRFNGAVKSKESELEGVIDRKDSLLEQYRKNKGEQLARIERLMRQIEPCLATDTAYTRSIQIARIEYLMRQIEEVLPKSD
jgi:tetratricopeptide (TPR) repeat protein